MTRRTTSSSYRCGQYALPRPSAPCFPSSHRTATAPCHRTVVAEMSSFKRLGLGSGQKVVHRRQGVLLPLARYVGLMGRPIAAHDLNVNARTPGQQAGSRSTEIRDFDPRSSHGHSSNVLIIVLAAALLISVHICSAANFSLPHDS